MYIKQIFENDEDFKSYLQQIFGNLQSTHCAADTPDQPAMTSFLKANHLTLDAFKDQDKTAKVSSLSSLIYL